MKRDPRLTPLTQKLQELMQRVEQMPAGGDLEGLIEEELTELDQLLVREALARRQQIASEKPEAFSPSGVPPLPKPDVSGPV